MIEKKGDWAFYVYDGAVEDPRFSFWLEYRDEGTGMCLYDRPPEGDGMWLDPDIGGDYEPQEPTTEFEQVLSSLLGDGVDAGKVAALPAHEEYFIRVIHGTVEENPGGLPNMVWSYMHDCRERWPEAGLAGGDQ